MKRNSNYYREWRKENDLLKQFLQDESLDNFEENDLLKHSYEYEDENNAESHRDDCRNENESCRDNPKENDREDFDQLNETDDYEYFSDDEILNDDNLNLILGETEEETENSEVSVEKNFELMLAEWVLRNKITRTASDQLLLLLKENGHSSLPKCTQTLLKTPHKVKTICVKCGGNYIYLGIVNGINRVIFSNGHLIVPERISLSVNIDGIPLFKSSSNQIWPILAKFANYPVFVISLWHGQGKPSSVDEFLHDFLLEYAEVIQNGYEFNGNTKLVEIEVFICDAPARQFLKNVKSHNGYFGCERCTVEGTWKSHRLMMYETNCPLRNKLAFNAYDYLGTHQIGQTPLINYGIDCVSHFVIDYMHLVCLGVVKRLLVLYLKEGPKVCRLSENQISIISNYLETFKGKCPSEFVRQPRSLKEVKRWKATEFRIFLLYTGPVVLKGVVSDDIYKHFLSLTLAMRIFLDTNDAIRNSHLSYAQELLHYFVERSYELYGSTFTVYNVHNLIHLESDSKMFNCSLDQISSFPFEDYLQLIKMFVRKAQNPLAQISKRIKEFENFGLKERTSKNHNVTYSIKDKDAWFLSSNGKFVKIKDILKDGKFRCEVYDQQSYSNVFTEPSESMHFNIAFLKLNCYNRSRMIILGKEDLIRKAVALPYKNKLYLSSLCHEIHPCK